MPIAGLEEWMKTPAEDRKAQEDGLKVKWDTWMATNKDMMAGPTAGVGKTKRVTMQGVADAKTKSCCTRSFKVNRRRRLPKRSKAIRIWIFRAPGLMFRQ